MKKQIPTTIFETDGRRTIRLYSYVALLTEKGGSEVKAVRYDGFQRATDVMAEIDTDYPGWKIRGVYKLSEEDFAE